MVACQVVKITQENTVIVGLSCRPDSENADRPKAIRVTTEVIIVHTEALHLAIHANGRTIPPTTRFIIIIIGWFFDYSLDGNASALDNAYWQLWLKVVDRQRIGGHFMQFFSGADTAHKLLLNSYLSLCQWRWSI